MMRLWWWLLAAASVGCGASAALLPPRRHSELDANGELLGVAWGVLERNWSPEMACTLPSRSQYPVQFSWDSCLISQGMAAVAASGAASFGPQTRALAISRARTELESLFSAQWGSGMVAHIRFNPRFPTSKFYFPGADEWQSWRAGADGPPAAWNTSGIVDPPLHASAVRAVFEAGGGVKNTQSLQWLRRVLPLVTGWMNFLARDRAVAAPSTTPPPTSPSSLIYLRHPWASGMDNAPEWDATLSTVPTITPFFNRTDCSHGVNCSQRPTQETYDRFFWLVVQGRNLKWNEKQLFDECPFLIADVLFNAAYARACDDMAALTEAAADPIHVTRAWRARAAAVRAEAQTRMWDDGLAAFVNLNARTGKQLPLPAGRDNLTITNVLALYGGLATPAQARKMATSWLVDMFCPGAAKSPAPWLCAPSVSPRSTGVFDAERYWRGPMWINTNWLLMRGIEEYYADDEVLQSVAAAARAAILQVGRQSVEVGAPFSEYYQPLTSAPLGVANFSWSAALYLDTALRAPAVFTAE